MYCKHCGKEIADDSKFCQYCGGKQDAIIFSAKENTDQKDNGGSINVSLNKSLTKLFSNRNKKYMYLYIIWIIINSILLCLGDDDYSTNKFYPFTGYYYSDSYGLIIENYFDSNYYDLSEFITYVILIPLLAWLLIKTPYKGKVIPLVKFIKTYGLMILVLIVIVVASIIAISRCSDDDEYYVREYYQTPYRHVQQSVPTQENDNNDIKELEKRFDSHLDEMNKQMMDITNEQINNLPSEIESRD